MRKNKSNNSHNYNNTDNKNNHWERSEHDGGCISEISGDDHSADESTSSQVPVKQDNDSSLESL